MNKEREMKKIIISLIIFFGSLLLHEREINISEMIDDKELNLSDVIVEDIKPLVGNHWNWVSFPRLERDNNEPVNAPDLLENMLPSLPGYLTLKDVYQNELNYDFHCWSDLDYMVRSSDGYKLNPEEDGDYILPESGSRLNPGYTITLYPSVPNWIGYWIPYTQNYLDALGDQIEHINYIKAEDWYLYKKHGEWYGMIGANGATFIYGKGYEIGVDEQISFSWAKVKSSEPFAKAEPEFFTYEDQPNYEMIEVESVEGGRKYWKSVSFKEIFASERAKWKNIPFIYKHMRRWQIGKMSLVFR